MDKPKLREALDIVNDAVYDLCDGNVTDETYYWWNAFLETFELETNGEGDLIVSRTAKAYHDKKGDKTFFEH